MSDPLQPLLVIAGATATGKTAAAIALARQLDGELVGADSVQVYRGFDIGSAKPSENELDGLPHHLLDVEWVPDRAFLDASPNRVGNVAPLEVVIDQLLGGTAIERGEPDLLAPWPVLGDCAHGLREPLLRLRWVGAKRIYEEQPVLGRQPNQR